jgi:hypothetical protein
MDLRALEPTGPYRLIVDGSTNRHIEYFESRRAALERWAEFDAAMRPASSPVDVANPCSIH